MSEMVSYRFRSKYFRWCCRFFHCNSPLSKNVTNRSTPHAWFYLTDFFLIHLLEFGPFHFSFIFFIYCKLNFCSSDVTAETETWTILDEKVQHIFLKLAFLKKQIWLKNQWYAKPPLSVDEPVRRRIDEKV